MPTREDMQRTALTTYAKELEVPEDLVLATGGQESGYNDAAVSKKGAKGTMQVMDTTSAEMAPKYGPDRRRQGVGYLKERLADPSATGDFEGDDDTRTKFALAGYNAGPGNLAKARKLAAAQGLDHNDYDVVSAFLPPETQQYVPGVLARRKASAGPTSVTAGAGVQDVAVGDDDPESELLALANGDTGKPDAPGDDDPEAELTAMAGGAEQPATPARGFVDSLYDRTIGSASRAVDSALGGLPSTLAGVAGAASAGDDAGIDEALAEGGGTAQRLKGVPLGVLETGVDLAFPGAVAAGAGVGAGVEKATGSKTAGDVAEFATNVAPAVAGVAKGTVRGAKALFGGKTAAEEVTAGLGAEKTAQEVGRDLQQPKGGAREAITSTANEATARYKTAGASGRAAGVTVSPASVVKTARQAMKDAKAAGNPVTGSSRRVLARLFKIARGQKSKLLDAAGKPISTGGRNLQVDELIDIQSDLRREISKLPYNNASRRHLIDVSKSMDDALQGASQGTPVAGELQSARDYYRETTLPTRKTASKVSAAAEPETATRVVTANQTPSRFQRIEKAAPGSAEPLRSAAFNDMVQQATEGGQLNVRKLATRLSKAEAAGQMGNLGNTVSRRQTIRAIQKVAKFQKAAQRAPVVGAVGGGATGLFGLGAGYATGRVVQVAMQSERASRALLRLAQARQGSAGWKVAAKKLKDILGPSAATAARTISSSNRETTNADADVR